MKHLTIACLLSLAPAALAKDPSCLLDLAPEISDAASKCGSCDRTEQVEEALPELKLLPSAEAQTATQATFTINGTAVDAEKWSKVVEYGRIVYGEPTTQEGQNVSWIFAREDRSLVEWFKHLSNVEAIAVAVKSTITSYCGEDAVTGTLSLENLN